MGEKREKAKTPINKESEYLIGYERLLDYFKDAQRATPKGVSLKKEIKPSGNYILLRFKLGNRRVAKTCNCLLTIDGIGKALEKAKLVADALKRIATETQFWNWYDDIILEKNKIKNDLLTFKDAIAIVEKYFWDGYTRKKELRDKTNPSHQATWYDVYGKFYKLLPLENYVNWDDILAAINQKKKGTHTYKICANAMLKLAETIENDALYKKIKKLDARQTIYQEDLQSISLDDFILLRTCVLDVPKNNRNYNLETRKQWLWVFSMQIVFGFRVSEVFALLNIDNPFTTKDRITIPPICDPKNKNLIAVVGDKTVIETTTKTGYRLARPMIPPQCLDLIDILDIRDGELPELELRTDNPITIRNKCAATARKRLVKWGEMYNMPIFTQTHALRHLANLHGMMAGISLEHRAMSLGHSPAMNDRVYKRRQTTKTTLDILTKSQQAFLPLESAIAIAKDLGVLDNPKIIKLLAAIYQVDVTDIR